MRARAITITVLLLGACAAPPVETTLGGFAVRLEPDGARITVRGTDGRTLLDSDELAFRSATASYEELIGAFRIGESGASEWQRAGSFSDIAVAPDRVSFRIGGVGDATGELAVVADGVLRLRVASASANRARAAFACAEDEQFLGFGAQPMDVAQRGQTVPIWVSEQGIGRSPTNDTPDLWFLNGSRHQSYAPDPFFVSSHGFGVQADSRRRSIFSMCSDRTEVWQVEAWEGTLSLTLFDGPTPLEVIARRSDQIGRAPAPPAWTFAPWHDAVRGAAEVRRIAALLRDQQIPSSAIWTEDWAGAVEGGGMYSLTYDWHVDRTLYPDIEQLAAELHTAGFKFLGYFNTFVDADSDHFQEGVDKGYVIHRADGTPYLFPGARLGDASLVDLSNPAAASWMGDAMREALALGFDGWMADFGEWLPVDAKLASGEDGEAAHNQYPLAWQRLNEQVLGARPDAQSFVRSAFVGSAAIGHQVVWGGDQTTDFDPGDGMPTALAIGLGLGVSGLPYYGSDVSGYFSGLGYPSGTEELFYRWTAFGALSPIMRTHHGVEAGKNWNWTSDAASLAHHKRWAEVHIRLYPYLRTAAEEAARSAAPMMRALALGFADDPLAWTIGDEYLLGPSLLVAPVLTAGAVSRLVYFPKGRWLPLFGASTGPPIEGPTRIEVAAPWQELPIYARAGTILPLLPAGIQTLVRTGGTPAGLEAADQGPELLVLLGADGALQEQGVRYTLSSAAAPDGTSALTWSGAALAACGATPTPPCAVVDAGQREALAHVAGDGALGALDASFSLVVEQSGGGGRVIHLRW